MMGPSGDLDCLALGIQVRDRPGLCLICTPTLMFRPLKMALQYMT